MSISQANQVEYLFKKALGSPETLIGIAYTGEASIFSKQNNFLFQNYAQSVPTTPPTDWANATIPNGITVSNVQYSSNYPYIYKYTYLTLTAVYVGLATAFNAPNQLLTNMIPASLSPTGAYTYNLYTNNLANDLSSGTAFGTYIIDPDSGILTFFTTPSYTGAATIAASNPPKITFYRYQGLTGNPGIAALQGGFA